eukprot:TRINITY_DN630_c0_g2_i1.p1 TRINITY_DN630_c0_g2~~TRINITY_DN630_c0_g2_i1.p1  ORF type:complete len:262 (+),score=51.39 TRINITY_DN630_c0_g2_i1:94-879(+)
MQTITFILAITFAVVLAGPTISNDFTALVDTFIDGKLTERVNIWEDYTGQKTRFDFRREQVSAEYIDLYATKKRYDITEDRRTCVVSSLNRTLEPLFSWAQTATKEGVCHSGFNDGRIGTLWSSNTTTADLLLCASADNHPYWVERKEAANREYYRFIVFIPGPPSQSAFTIPTYCQAKLPGGPFSCEICTFIVNYVESFASQNRTTEVIEKALDEVCGVLPDLFRAECDGYVAKYTPQIVQLILNEEDPTTVCTQIGLCQ